MSVIPHNSDAQFVLLAQPGTSFSCSGQLASKELCGQGVSRLFQDSGPFL